VLTGNANDFDDALHAAFLNVNDQYFGTALHCLEQLNDSKTLLRSIVQISDDGVVPEELQRIRAMNIANEAIENPLYLPICDENFILRIVEKKPKYHCMSAVEVARRQRIANFLLSDSDDALRYSDANGNSALHMAVSEGHIDFIRKLLGHKDIDISIQNSYNRTPLVLALREERDEEFRLIAEYAATHRRGELDCSLFRLAYNHKNPTFLKILLDIPSFDSWYKDPIYVDAIFYIENMFNFQILLQDERTDVNMKSNNKTLLELAVETENNSMVQMLLAHPELKFHDSATLFKLACKQGDFYVLHKFIEDERLTIDIHDAVCAYFSTTLTHNDRLSL